MANEYVGFVKFPRELLLKDWSNNPNVWNLYTHILLKANYNDGVYKGDAIPSGSFVTSIRKLAKLSGLKVEQTKYTLRTLENAQLITQRTTHSYTVISVINWGYFQGHEKNTTQNTTQELHTLQHKNSPKVNNNQRIKEYQENKNSKKDILVNNKDENSDICEYPYQEIIDYLNRKTNKNFKVTNDVRRIIKARFNEDFTKQDFFKVIDNMNEEWRNDEKMSNYLRPKTLFSTKFDSYLNRTKKMNEYERMLNL